METAGYGLIETLRVREGRISFLEGHLARLAASTAVLGLPRPAQDPATLLRPFAGTEDAVLRLEGCGARGGPTLRGLPPPSPPAVVTASEPHQPYPPQTTPRDCFADAAPDAGNAE